LRALKRRVVSNIISRGFGKFASHRFHPLLQKIINRSYARLMKVDLSEFESAEKYDTLNELFVRELKKRREIDLNESAVISPTDSLVTESSYAVEGRAMQIKGMEYSLSELLREIDPKNLNRVSKGGYINLYLSPRDYHRYHVPCDMYVKKAVHIPGRLYPVNLRYLKKRINLFVENERVVLECETMQGILFYIVLVGALNVGQMRLVFESRIETNRPGEISVYEYGDLMMRKGELLGYFKMGSTVVMIFENGRIRLAAKRGEKVKYGQKIAEII